VAGSTSTTRSAGPLPHGSARLMVVEIHQAAYGDATAFGDLREGFTGLTL